MICSRRLRDANLLISPLDYGWLPYILLTGLSVLVAASPRRSLESWLWLIGIQLPIAYGALYLFRRRWPERGLYRALLGAGGYLYLLSAMMTLSYLSQWLAARAQGITPPGFRLFGVMDHPNIFAMFIAISTPCMVAYLFTRLSRVERAAATLWLVAAALSILATGSRTGLAALVAGCALSLVLSLVAHPAQPLNRFRQWFTAHRSRAIGLTLAAGMVCILVLGIAVYLQFGRPRQDSGGGRLTFYRSAIAMFAARPVLGYGPGGFVQDEIRTNSVPPYSAIMPHAHDILLNTAAESGVLGTVGLLSLMAAAAWTSVRVWRTEPSRRALIAGPIAGLVAFALFGVLDSPINQFGPFFLVTVLLAYVASWLPAPQTSPPLRKGLIVGATWAVVLLCVLVLIPYSVLWDVARPDAPEASFTDPNALASSAQRLDAVMAYDSADPLVTLQSAYNWANAVTLSRNAPDQWLQNAITRFERGVQLDPDLSIHYVNLSALYLRAGRTADAIRTAQQATERAPSDGVAWLNLGLALESDGQDAQAAYLRALQAEPRWFAMGFWQLSPVRQPAYAAYMSAPEAGKRYYDLLAAGDTALHAGQKEAALKAYTDASKVAPGDVAQTYTRALVALARGDVKAAQSGMGSVTTMDILYPDDQAAFVDAWLHLGDFARDRGDTETMLRNYSLAYSYLTARGMSGLGSRGSWGYATIGFQRFARVNDYLPDVVMIDISPEQAARFKVLAQEVAKSGNPEGAKGVYRKILESNPNDQDAKAALQQLESQRASG
jgi:O-antigen ligase/tetratricopeptide (TPR) repeat protein